MRVPTLEIPVLYLGSGNFDRRSDISVVRWTRAQINLSGSAVDPIHATLKVDSSGVQLISREHVVEGASANSSAAVPESSRPVSSSSVEAATACINSTRTSRPPILSHRGSELLRVIPLSGRVPCAGPTDLCYTTRAPNEPNLLRCHCHVITVPDPHEVRAPQFIDFT